MERLKIAIQKSGRLSDKSIELFEKAGISASNNSSRLLFASASDFPIDILYLRDDDIPQCVADGVADAGIVGENVIWETGQKVVTAFRSQFPAMRSTQVWSGSTAKKSRPLIQISSKKCFKTTT